MGSVLGQVDRAEYVIWNMLLDILGDIPGKPRAQIGSFALPSVPHSPSTAVAINPSFVHEPVVGAPDRDVPMNGVGDDEESQDDKRLVLFVFNMVNARMDGTPGDDYVVKSQPWPFHNLVLYMQSRFVVRLLRIIRYVCAKCILFFSSPIHL